MLETVSSMDALLPADRLRYFMGIGDPEGILEVIARGVDMFDCVLPTGMARTGTAFARGGRLNLRNARYAADLGPLDEDCDCSCCRTFTRSYLRHLVNQKEILGIAAAQSTQPAGSDTIVRARPAAPSAPGVLHEFVKRRCGARLRRR